MTPYSVALLYIQIMIINFSEKLWEYDGNASWHFITVPAEHAQAIKEVTASEPRRGFGSVKVEVTIGSSNWKTSVFPDSSNGTYLLPVKKEVRTTEKISAGDMVELQITILEI